MRKGYAPFHRTFLALLAIFFHFYFTTTAQEIPPKNYSVMASATAIEPSAGGPQLILTWLGDGAATSYKVSRRTISTSWQQVALLPGSATRYDDFNVVIVRREIL